MIEIEFSSAIVARRENGTLAIAIFDGLPKPFEQERACVALLTCSDSTAQTLCLGVAAVAGSTTDIGGN